MSTINSISNVSAGGGQANSTYLRSVPAHIGKHIAEHWCFTGIIKGTPGTLDGSGSRSS